MKEKSKKIGLFGALTMGIGCIIGSGIFGSLPEVINDVGPGIVWALIASAVVVILRSIPATYSTAVLPSSARYVMHMTKLLHPVVGLLEVFNSFLITSMLALYGVLFGEYFLVLFPSCTLSEELIGCILIVVFCVISLFGNHSTAKLETIMVILMTFTLLLYSVLGISNIDASNISLKDILAPGMGMSGLAVAVGVLSSSLSGGAIVAEISDDVKNPKRNIPLTIILCPCIVCVLYIVMAIVTVSAGTGGLESLADIAATFMSPGLLVFFVVCGPVLGIITSFIPFLLSMVAEFEFSAKLRVLPKFLSKRNKNGVAYWSVVMAMVISIVIILTGQTFGVIMTIFSFANIIEEAPNTLVPFFAKKKYPKTCANTKTLFAEPVIWICSIVSFCIMIYLGVELFISMDTISWVGVVVTYALGFIYFFIRRAYLIKKENYDLFKELGKTYGPWDEVEKSL